MARKRRGWGGDPPATDEEAAQRIVAAAVELISDTGAAITIADVAESLGVIRQTVYRYFPTAGDLMRAAGIASVDGFLDQLAQHVSGIHDPAEALTEGVLYTSMPWCGSRIWRYCSPRRTPRPNRVRWRHCSRRTSGCA